MFIWTVKQEGVLVAIFVQKKKNIVFHNKINRQLNYNNRTVAFNESEIFSFEQGNNEEIIISNV